MRGIDSVDVIVYPKGNISQVKHCLESIVAKKTILFNLIIVNDGQDKRIRTYIKLFAKKYPSLLIDRKDVEKYRHTTNGTYTIFLHESTTVEHRWIERYLESRYIKLSVDLRKHSVDPAILFLLPVKGGSGGVHSVFQETSGLRALNVNAKIATKLNYKANLKKHYPDVIDDCIFYENEKELIRISQHFDIVIATSFNTIKTLNTVIEHHPHIKPAYYIQDYEPYFFERGSKRYKEAQQSYEMIPNIYAFAKTEWLCNLVKEKHDLDVYKVQPSLDRSIYKPKLNIRKLSKTIFISAMIRPSTPWRSPKRTLQLLKKIKENYDSKVEITIFGCTNAELYAAWGHDVEIYNYGVLKRHEVATLFQKSNIFIDLSSYQAFGRTGLEAMAVGCCTILPKKGGVTEYAVHEENSFLVDIGEDDKVIKYVSHLIEDSKLREKITKHALKTANRYSIEGAALSEFEFFQKIMNNDKE